MYLLRHFFDQVMSGKLNFFIILRKHDWHYSKILFFYIQYYYLYLQKNLFFWNSTPVLVTNLIWLMAVDTFTLIPKIRYIRLTTCLFINYSELGINNKTLISNLVKEGEK